MPRITKFDDLPEQARTTVVSLVAKNFCQRNSGWEFDYEFPLTSITGHEQVRVGKNYLVATRVNELKEMRDSGVLMPPIVTDINGYLLEGKHRLAASEKRKDPTIQAVILQLDFFLVKPEEQLALREFGIWANHNTGPMDFQRQDKRVIIDRILNDYAALGIKPTALEVAARLRFPRPLVQERIDYRSAMERSRARWEQAEQSVRTTVVTEPDGTVVTVTREAPLTIVNPTAVAKLAKLSDERAALLEPVFIKFEEERGKLGADKADDFVREIRYASADELPIKIADLEQQLSAQVTPGSNQLRTAITSTSLGGNQMSLSAAVDYVLTLVQAQDCVEHNPSAYDLHMDKVSDIKARLIKLIAALTQIIDDQKKEFAAKAQEAIDDALAN